MSSVNLLSFSCRMMKVHNHNMILQYSWQVKRDIYLAKENIFEECSVPRMLGAKSMSNLTNLKMLFSEFLDSWYGNTNGCFYFKHYIWFEGEGNTSSALFLLLTLRWNTSSSSQIVGIMVSDCFSTNVCHVCIFWVKRQSVHTSSEDKIDRKIRTRKRRNWFGSN